MLKIVLIAFAAAVGYFLTGAAALVLLRSTGAVRKFGICEEEQIAAVALWPLYLTIILPVYLAVSIAKRIAGDDGKHTKR